MGFLDNARDQLVKAVNTHGDTITGGIDKASAAIDSRTGGKHSDRIATGAARAKDALGRLDRGTPGASTTPEPGGPSDPATPAPPPPVNPTDPIPSGPPTDPSSPTGHR